MLFVLLGALLFPSPASVGVNSVQFGLNNPICNQDGLCEWDMPQVLRKTVWHRMVECCAVFTVQYGLR
jgi:hypothetical protein